MARVRREALREATFEEIKTTARKLMTQRGTAGLSMRAIARELGMTAPALYYYYTNLDELITTLILEDYHALADAMEQARDQHETGSYRQQLVAVLEAYRQWALDHPIDFQLIYGNPIPGYEAPAQLTIPAASRGLAVPTGIIAAGLAAGEFRLPQETIDLPPSILKAIQQVAEERDYETPVEAVYLAVTGWTQVHGLVSLELYDAFQPVIGDTTRFFQRRLQTIIDQLM